MGSSHSVPESPPPPPPPPYTPYVGSSSESRTLPVPTSAMAELSEDNITPAFVTRSLDPDWIDIEVMGHWLRKCDMEHGEQCRRPFAFDSSSFGRANLLIDVQKKCLVIAKPDHRYACLSYVWGGSSTLKTGMDNLVSLTEENSLQIRRNEIPRTIRDAIDLVDQLGIPYFWVDALCIVQDDTESKHDQIQAMAGIYANAYVTIIAGNGWDANHGLRGIQGVTEPRHLSTSLKTDFRENLQPHSSIWYSRGWTFQEMIFSPRMIMFQYKLAVWECNKACWNESSFSKIPAPIKIPLEVMSISPWHSRIKVSSWPDVKQYVALVGDYTTRKLTYGDDAAHAITSLLSVMSYSFAGGFISGLPEMFFDEALLWQPEEPMQWRQSCDPLRPSLPSWSWIGWEGRIMTAEWWRQWSHLYLNPSWRIHPTSDLPLQVSPLVSWFYGNEVSGERFPVHVSGQIYIKFINSTSSLLPARWEAIKGQHGTEYIFDNQSSTTSQYPVPVAANRSPSVKSARFLFCHTGRAYFKVMVHSRLGRIEDSMGKWAGKLNLNLVQPFKESGTKFKVELVAISTGIVMAHGSENIYFGSQEMLLDEMGWESLTVTAKGSSSLGPRRYEFYYVLWIEWVDGIAYRRGLGLVLKEAWEREATEEIDLILG